MTWDLQLDVLDVWRKAGLPGLVEPYRSEQFCCAEALCNVPNDTVVARGVRLQLDGDGSTYCGVGDIVIKKRRTGQRSAVVQGINWDSKPVGIKRYKRAVWDVDLRVGHGGQQLVAHGKLTAEAADRGASTKRSLSTAAERGQPMVGGRYAGAGAPLGKPQATAGNESATMEGQPHKLFNNRLRIRKRKSGSDRRKLVGFTITDAIPFAEAASLHDSSHSLLADKPFHSVPAELAGDRKKFKQFLTSIGVDGRPAVYTFAFRSPKRGLKLAYVGKASGGLLRRLLCYVGQYGAIGPASEPIKFLPWSWLQAHGCTVEVRFAYVSTGLNATRLEADLHHAFNWASCDSDNRTDAAAPGYRFLDLCHALGVAAPSYYVEKYVGWRPSRALVAATAREPPTDPAVLQQFRQLEEQAAADMALAAAEGWACFSEGEESEGEESEGEEME